MEGSKPRILEAKGDVFGLVAMSDWILTTLPLAVVIYFLVNPAQLAVVLAWMGTLVH